MRSHRCISLPSLFLVLAAGWTPAFGGDSAAEAALKAKGLVKTGRVFVEVQAEKPVLAKMKEVKAAFAGYSSLAEKRDAFERSEAQSAQLEGHRVDLKTSLDELNQRIIEQATWQAGNNPPRQGSGNGPAGGGNSSSPLIMQRDQVKAALNEVTVGQKTLKPEAPVVKDKAALDDEVKKKGEAFKSALAELRPMVDQVTAKYAELDADESVKRSLEEVKKITKVKPALGPSEAFLAAAKELDQAERRFLGKKTAAPTKKKSKSKK